MAGGLSTELTLLLSAAPSHRGPSFAIATVPLRLIDEIVVCRLR